MSSHMMRGRQLSRDTEHRIAMRRNLVQSLFEHGKVRTTHPKAKECKAMAEKLITLAKQGTLTARRRVISALNDRRLTDENQEFILNARGNARTVVQRLFEEIAPKFEGRPGGYTRIIKLPDHRIGDGSSLVLLQLLTDESKPSASTRKSAGYRRKKYTRRTEFAARARKARETAAPAAE